MRLAVLSLSICFALLNIAAAPSNPLVGDWYMEGVEHGLHAQFIIRNLADGTFTKHIRDDTDCSAPKKWTETGTWSMDDGHYIAITQTVDNNAVASSAPEFKDTFDYAMVDESHSTMHDVKTNITWTMTRVSSDYTMPPSNNCGI